MTRIAARLIARAGWAPILVFGLHIFLARATHVYQTYRWSDVPMHFLGGLAIAYFLSSCFSALPRDSISPGYRPAVQFVFVITATVTAGVLWEFAEYAADAIFSTRQLGDVFDTLQDLALGMSGGTTYMLITWWRGKLGMVQPIETWKERRT
jgi:hypothetical protein